MLWLLGIALLASYYISETLFQTVAVLSLIVVAVSIVAALVGVRTVRNREEVM